MGESTVTGDVSTFAVLVGVALVDVTPEHRFLVPPTPRSQVRLNADDRLHRWMLFGLTVEVRRPEGVPVVGDRHGGHPHTFSHPEQVAQLGGTVEHRILG